MVPIVLVVEPYADLRAGIVSALQRLDFECEAVATADAAVLKLRDHDYKYVIVDVDSETRDESEQLVDSLAPATNVIVIDDHEVEWDGSERRQNLRNLQKPFDKDELRRIMT